jgi:hypothetical protein
MYSVGRRDPQFVQVAPDDAYNQILSSYDILKCACPANDGTIGTPVVFFRVHARDRLYVVSPVHVKEALILVDPLVPLRIDDNTMPALRLRNAITCSSEIQNLLT